MLVTQISLVFFLITRQWHKVNAGCGKEEHRRDSKAREEEEVEGGGGEELEVGEGGDDEDYEREAPPPSDIDGCDWDGLSTSFMT